MEAVVNVGNLLQYLLLNWKPPGDDTAELIGDSRVAYLSKKDPAHVFLAAARWHDAAYVKGASIQSEWPRWRVDAYFQQMMLKIAEGDLQLQKDACSLYLMVRIYGCKMYEGREL